jgi:hypothetical protein
LPLRLRQLCGKADARFFNADPGIGKLGFDREHLAGRLFLGRQVITLVDFDQHVARVNRLVVIDQKPGHIA